MRNKVFIVRDLIALLASSDLARVNVLLKIITQTTLLAALVIVVAGGLLVLPPKINQMRRLERQRNEMLRKIEHKKHEIESLKIKQQRFANDPDFVEHIARENKRVRPNELLFVFDPDEPR